MKSLSFLFVILAANYLSANGPSMYDRQRDREQQESVQRRYNYQNSQQNQYYYYNPEGTDRSNENRLYSTPNNNYNDDQFWDQYPR